MTPSHSNKRGVRYRYYVSHAILQKRHDEAGTVARVPAPDVEAIVIEALNSLQDQAGDGSPPTSDRELVERHVDRIIVGPQAIDIHLLVELDSEDSEQSRDSATTPDTSGATPAVIAVPWAAAMSEAVKGILHSPSSNRTMSSESRNTLLMAIARARSWISDLMEGRVASFTEIAEREGRVVRHVRFLALLAFASPRITSAIIDGSAPADLTVTDLAKSLPHSWIEQERRLGLPHA